MAKPSIEMAVRPASRISVFLLLQKPYSHATTNVKGKPINAELRSSPLAACSLKPIFCRSEGIQSRNPKDTSPTPSASRTTEAVIGR